MGQKIDFNISKIRRYILRQKIKIFTPQSLGLLLSALKNNDWVGQRCSLEELIETMSDFKIFSLETFAKSDLSNSVARYVIGEVQDITITSTPSNHAFFTHGTALSLHGAGMATKNVYQTIIQHGRKENENNLNLQNIDSSFSRPQRLPANFYK